MSDVMYGPPSAALARQRIDAACQEAARIAASITQRNSAVVVLTNRIAEIDRGVQDKLAVIASHRKPIDIAEAAIEEAKREREEIRQAIGLIEGAQGA